MADMKKLTFEAIAIEGDVGYASDYNKNSLFKVDMITGECSFICFFEDEPVNFKRLHCSAIRIENRIYFIPGSGNRIDVFYPDDNFIESIKIPLPKSRQYSFYIAPYKFIRAVKRGNNLWLVPSTYPGVIKLDLQTNKIKVFNEWIENDEYMFRIGVCVEGKNFIAANGKSNAVLIFDMEKESGKIVHIGSKNSGTMSMCKVGDDYWLAPRLPGAIVSWNPLSETVTEYDDFPMRFTSGNIVFSKLYTFEDKIIFPPAQANLALVYNNGKIEVDESIVWKKHNSSTLEYLFETEKDRYFREIANGESDRCIKISKSDNSLSEYAFCFLDDGKREKTMLEILSSKHVILRENRNIGLNDFIKGLL